MKTHKQEIDPVCRHDPEHKYWTTKDRGDIALCQMTIEHINNCISMCRRNLSRVGQPSYYAPEDAILYQLDYDHIEDQIDMLQGEITRRNRINHPYRLGV